MHKLTPSKAFCFIILAFLWCVMLLQSSITDTKAGYSYKNNFLISDQSIQFLLKDNALDHKDVETLEKMSDSFSIASIMAVGHTEVAFLYTSDTDLYSDFVTAGSFFDSEDFFSDTHKALVGKDILSGKNKQFEIKKQGETQYLSLWGAQYEIIGCIGEKRDSVLDNLIMANLNDSSPVRPNIYFLDSPDKQQIKQCYSQIEQTHLVEKINREESFLEKTIGTANYRIVQAFASLLYLITVLCGILFMHHYYKDYICVSVILGIPLGKTLQHIGLQIWKRAVIVYIICLPLLLSSTMKGIYGHATIQYAASVAVIGIVQCLLCVRAYQSSKEIHDYLNR